MAWLQEFPVCATSGKEGKQQAKFGQSYALHVLLLVRTLTGVLQPLSLQEELNILRLVLADAADGNDSQLQLWLFGWDYVLGGSGLSCDSAESAILGLLRFLRDCSEYCPNLKCNKKSPIPTNYLCLWLLSL